MLVFKIKPHIYYQKSGSNISKLSPFLKKMHVKYKEAHKVKSSKDPG